MCPKCGFGSYGARYVYGDAAYRYQYSQKPWYDKKTEQYQLKLFREIRETAPKKPKPPRILRFGNDGV